MNNFQKLNTRTRQSSHWAAGFGKAIGVGTALGLVLAGAGVRADDAEDIAPPVQPEYSQPIDGQYGDPALDQVSTTPSQDSVFNWKDVPQNQRVPLTRAVFDRGGYQLYDTVGETIIVPFTNQNLYVMKFGQSTDGTTYFENEGGFPVLYVPVNGYLENASAAGTRWYPFPKTFHYEEPVFLGVAPSWPEFVDMGWYPGMEYYGGYYSRSAFISGDVFLPTLGLSIFIGGHPYYGWSEYHHYYDRHPAPYRLTIVNNYHYHSGGHSFYGAGHGYSTNHGFGGGRTFGGERTFGGGRTFHGGGEGGANHSFGGGTASHSYYAHRTFRGAGGGGNSVRSYGGDSQGARGGTHTFGGGERSTGSTHSFNGEGGGRSYGSAGGHTFSGGEISHATATGRSFNGGSNHSNGGGGSRSNGGGGTRSGNGGGERSGGEGHSNGGGGRR